MRRLFHLLKCQSSYAVSGRPVATGVSRRPEFPGSWNMIFTTFQTAKSPKSDSDRAAHRVHEGSRTLRSDASMHSLHVEVEVVRGRTRSHEGARGRTRSNEITRRRTRSYEVARGHTRSNDVARGRTRSHEITRGRTRSHEVARDRTRSHEAPGKPWLENAQTPLNP